jgi:pSer/pThr/pTyr-binding forkhead associated (FHA) protein
LVLAICLPLLAVLIRMSRPLTRSEYATRRYRPRRDDEFDANVADDAAAGGLRRHPFVEIENGRGQRCAILRDMLRLGREDDNDIRIPSRYVHRYHAAIHREDFDDWLITDLTGVESNGLIVNGKRCCEARLNDGDLIQLGPGKLRFRFGAR